MNGVPADLYSRVRAALLASAYCATDSRLRDVFAHQSLVHWYHKLPEAHSPEERANQTLAFLAQMGDGTDNALILLLRVLSSQIAEEDELHAGMASLAEELKPHLPTASSVAQERSPLETWLDGPRFVFADIVADRTAHFSGRKWVFDAVGDWLAQVAQRPFLLTGEPGTGKTAVAARLMQFSADPGTWPDGERLPPAAFLTAAHICSAQRPRTIDPRLITERLIRQLADRCPPFRAAVLAMGGDPREQQSTLALWETYLLQPLEMLKDVGVIILVDSLDEAQQYRGAEPLTIVDLLARSLDLPNLRWMFTSRDEPAVTSHLLTTRRLDLIRDAPRDVYEVREYAKARLNSLPPERRLSPEARDALATRIAAPDLGNFLYARYVLDDLIPRLAAGEAPENIDLPANLAALYAEFLARKVGTEPGWRGRIPTLLGALATAQGEGLPFGTLQGITGQEADGLNDALDPWRAFLAPGTTGPFRLYHQSFADFLLKGTAAEPPPLDQVTAHRRTATRLLERWGGQWDQADPYAVRYLPTHLLEGRAGESTETAAQLIQLLTNLSYLGARAALEKGETWPLEQDFARAISESPPTANQTVLAAFSAALRQESHALREQPGDCYMQLYNRLWSNDGGPVDHVLTATAQGPARPWLRARSPLPVSDPALARLLSGHSGGVRTVAVSGDGRLVVSGGTDGPVRLWEGASGVARGVLAGHSGWVWAVAVSGDGRLVVSSGADGTVRLWEGASGMARGVLRGRSGRGWAVAVSGDGRLVVSGGADGTVRLWDGTSGAARGELRGHSGGVEAVAVSGDGRLVISGGADGTVRLWDGASGAARGVLRGHSGGVWAVAVSGDGRLVVSGGADGTVRLWDGTSGAEREELRGHSGGVRAVAVSGDGRLVVSGGADGPVGLWEGASGVARGVLAGHSGGVEAVAVSGDGRLVVSGGTDGTVRLWDGASGAVRGELRGHSERVWAVAVSGDGRLVVSSGADGTVRLWERTSGAARGELRGHSEGVEAVAVSGDGRLVVSGGADGTVRLWAGHTRFWSWILWRWQTHGLLAGHNGGVQAVAVSGDGRLVVSGGADGTVRLWAGHTRFWSWIPWRQQARGVLAGHSGEVTAVAVSGDGQLVVSGGADGTVRLWEGTSGMLRGVLRGHSGRVEAVAVSGDSRLVVSGGADGTVRLWDGASGAARGELCGHSRRVEAVAVSGDGRLVVSGGADRTVRVWDAATVTEVAHYTWDAPIIYCGINGADRSIVVGDQRSQVLTFTLEGLR